MSDDLKPQEPGAAAAESRLEAIADGNVGDLIEILDTLTAEELQDLHALEAAGKNRVTALDAIQRELHSRDTGADNEPQPSNDRAPVGDAESYKAMRAVDVDPSKLSSPVLTRDGWVLPLAKAQPEG